MEVIKDFNTIVYHNPCADGSVALWVANYYKEIVEKTLEHLKKLKETNTKEWKIGKKKYILKNGEYGYYIEEWSITTNKKKGNYSLKFLINKIAKNNDLDISKNNDLNKTIELITNKDIEESVEYFLNNKKNKSAKFNKK